MDSPRTTQYIPKQKTSRSRQELKIAKVLACCVAAFLICWTPYATVAQLGINGAQHLISPYTSEIPVIFAKTSSVWNPLIYALSHPQYRQAILRAFNRILCSLTPDKQKSQANGKRRSGLDKKVSRDVLSASSESLYGMRIFRDCRILREGRNRISDGQLFLPKVIQSTGGVQLFRSICNF